MDRFLKNGHLTHEALKTLATSQPLPPLIRYQIAEHLSYCNTCLMRYTALLTDAALLIPETSCQPSLWRRICRQTLQMLTSRYATAVAAVAIVFSLWNFGVFHELVTQPQQLIGQTQWTERFDGYPQHWTVVSQSIFKQIGQTLHSAFGTALDPENLTSGGMQP